MDCIRCTVRAVPNSCWRHKTLYYRVTKWKCWHFDRKMTWLMHRFGCFLFMYITFLQFVYVDFYLRVCFLLWCFFCFIFVQRNAELPTEFSLKSICGQGIANGTGKPFRWRDVFPFLRWNRYIFSRLLRIHVKDQSSFCKNVSLRFHNDLHVLFRGETFLFFVWRTLKSLTNLDAPLKVQSSGN